MEEEIFTPASFLKSANKKRLNSATKPSKTKQRPKTTSNMSIGFYVVNKEFLEKLEDYIKYNAEVEREKFNEIPSRIFKATIAYQYLCTLTDKSLTLEQILEKHSDLGLIGPGSGFLSRVLEKLFGKLKTFKKYAMLHDVFGNFYADFEEGPGYCYASPIWLPSFMRENPLMGQISGLMLCSKTDFSYE